MSSEMKLRPAGYSPVAKTFHWAVAVLVMGIIPAGIIMTNLSSGPFQNNLYDLHRSFGTLILGLMAARIGYRLMHGSPAPEASLKRWEVIVSEAVHGLLYVLVVGTALMGWAGTSAYGAAIRVFGLFTLPPLLAKDQALGETLLGIHGKLGFLVGLLALLHIGAALQHYVIKKDGVLQRMLPARRS